MIAQGFDLTKNSYHNRFQPYVSYWGAGWTLFFIFINGFEVFWNFNATDFLTACMYLALQSLHCHSPSVMHKDINIPLFLILYFGFKWVKKTSFWKPHEMDFVTVSVHLSISRDFAFDDFVSL